MFFVAHILCKCYKPSNSWKWRLLLWPLCRGYVTLWSCPPVKPTTTKDVIIDLTFDGGQTSTNLNNVYSYLKDFQLLGVQFSVFWLFWEVGHIEQPQLQQQDAATTHAKRVEYVSKELLNLWFGEGWRMTLRFNRCLAERSTNWFVSLGWWCGQLCCFMGETGWFEGFGVWRYVLNVGNRGIWGMFSEWDMVRYFCWYACSHFHSRLEIVLNLLHVRYMCIMGCSRD